eukprot:CAMPEP_0115089660 /NCGR_PEP_ID=MMETSP0227-20121206/24860_1 /TAXON_ID=89957 /ORGANISM="Polarella glacialis, Strain CCMP 1383" /LENGTH=64 /DNA_ID=CAMNT_0002480445 /DNA_START=274 /DNA_END=468 /DNA_ORIENTATION=-
MGGALLHYDCERREEDLKPACLNYQEERLTAAITPSLAICDLHELGEALEMDSVAVRVRLERVT